MVFLRSGKLIPQCTLCRVLSLLRIFVKFSHKAVYPTVDGEKFHIYAVQIIGKCIYESKNWIYKYLLMHPQVKFSLRFLSSPLGRGKLLIPPRQQCFLKICFPSRVGEGGGLCNIHFLNLVLFFILSMG